MKCRWAAYHGGEGRSGNILRGLSLDWLTIRYHNNPFRQGREKQHPLLCQCTGILVSLPTNGTCGPEGGGGWGELCRTQLFPPTSEPNMRGTLTPQSCSFLYHRYVSVFDTFNPVSGREVHPLGGKSSRASSSTTGNRAHTHTHKPYFTSASISRVVITLKLSPSPCTACPLLLLMNESGESTMMIWCIYLVGHPTFDPTMKLSD